MFPQLKTINIAGVLEKALEWRPWNSPSTTDSSLDHIYSPWDCCVCKSICLSHQVCNSEAFLSWTLQQRCGLNQPKERYFLDLNSSRSKWAGRGAGRMSRNHSAIGIVCCWLKEVLWHLFWNKFSDRLAFCAIFTCLFCCLARTGPELDLGSMSLSTVQLALHDPTFLIKRFLFFNIQNDWSQHLVTGKVTDNLLKMSHFCTRLQAPWLIITSSETGCL